MDNRVFSIFSKSCHYIRFVTIRITSQFKLLPRFYLSVSKVYYLLVAGSYVTSSLSNLEHTVNYCRNQPTILRYLTNLNSHELISGIDVSCHSSVSTQTHQITNSHVGSKLIKFKLGTQPTCSRRNSKLN